MPGGSVTVPSLPRIQKIKWCLAEAKELDSHTKYLRKNKGVVQAVKKTGDLTQFEVGSDVGRAGAWNFSLLSNFSGYSEGEL